MRRSLELPYPAEFFWLLALVFFLPLFEAPKNICWGAYVLTWLYNRARARDWGGPWDRWDGLIGVWIASAYVVAAFAGVHHEEWMEANDVLRYVSVLWTLKRSRYDERPVLWILGTVIAGTLLALAWGYWRVYVAQTNQTLGLNSVGHVNHSAIYMDIVFGCALGMALAYWKRGRILGRAVLGFAVLALVASVFLTDSRAAAGAAVLFIFALVAALGVRKRIDALRGLFTASLVVVVALAALPGVMDKTVDRSERGITLAYRDSIWSNALVEWRQFPLFGVGMGNFGYVPLERLVEWNQSWSWGIRATPEGVNSHAHSLYVTTLAERGIAGLSVVIAVLAAWGVSLWRGVPQAQDPPLDWALFGASLAAWLTTAVVGLANTTLHHEHGILSAALLGIWLSHRAAHVPAERG
ncbi:MAG TPA: O-antigen ligase family protein [Burkholderiales bacterium]|nr:O-antigen ligase family protein [Burkholderiales bacterium]